jgi:uncharacterized protein YndB with AHSA1/START domain
MNAPIVIAPVRKSVRVKAPLAHAFDVFTSGLTRWWPLDHGVGKKPIAKVLMEPRLGGRWLEIAEDGTQTPVATIILWEPPHRLVMVWQINAQWRPDLAMKSEVDVRSRPMGRTLRWSNCCITSSKRWVRSPALRCAMMLIAAGPG